PAPCAATSPGTDLARNPWLPPLAPTALVSKRGGLGDPRPGWHATPPPRCGVEPPRDRSDGQTGRHTFLVRWSARERPPGGEDPAQVGAQPERGSEQSPGLCLPGTCEGRRDQAPAARLGGGRDERAQLAGRAREQAEREPSAQLRIGNRGA